MCDVCTQFKLQASKSCLVCLVSYCEAHLEPHHRVPTLRRHGLIEPVENLEERVCEKHSRVMELFCRQERVCICLLCSEAEHKGHQFVPVEEEAALQRENIESKEAQIKLMINDRMEKIKGVTEISEMSKVKAAQEMEHSEKLFTTLMEKVQNNQTKLKSNIEEKMRKSQERMQTVVGKLQEQIAELQRKNEKLQEISQNQDSLHLLQTLHSLQTILDQASSTQFWVYSDLCLETLRTSVSHIIDAFRAELKTLTCTESVTFDPSTAGGNLVVSDFGKRLKHPKITYSSSSSDDTDKFNLPMILGTKGFTSGRHYWEVIVGLRNNWDVGVAAETADRSGGAVLKRENGFFAIGKRGFDYQVHTTPYTVLHLCPRPKTLGVYLDYDEGRVSFYDVGEKLHIHSFVGMEFTGKLFPKMSLQVCHCCGWSKVTSYQGLRIHQGKKGCTPKGMRVMEHQQQYLFGQRNSMLDFGRCVIPENLEWNDLSLQVCHCGWTKETTYQELLIHQERMGCTLKGGLLTASAEPPRSAQRANSARYLEKAQVLTQNGVSGDKQINHGIKLEPKSTNLQSNFSSQQLKDYRLDKLENELRDVEAVFTEVFNILEVAQAAAMQPLEERKWLLEKEAKEMKDELGAEMTKLQVAVYELEYISALEDQILFLQRFPSLANQDDMKDWTEVELDTSLSFGSMRKITEELIEKFQQELNRLSSIAFWGLNCFSSGRSYWEVEVGNKTGWDLGVATGGASRKGKLTLSPENGYWVLVHYEEEKYAAMASVPLSLFLKENPTRVGLFVDYEEGLVSFYDVRAQSHIYSFTECSFKEELYPYFSPHLRVEEKNAQPLVICSGKQLEK
ncbi:Pyrin [Oryzias melastigma]|uniref:Pyrin n=1 Tax=Oryzias melastigma TaxID=30732 RepID=A0A834FDR5_ORYME|nr:Pyrin [Oryzias melastigma]